MRRYLLALLCLIAWAYPHPIQAQETKIQFNVDPSLSEPKYIHAPLPPEFQSHEPSSVAPRPAIKQNKSTKRNPVSGQCSCVLYVKAKTGYSKSVGAARNFPVNSNIPSPGAVIVTYESSLGHVGIVSHADEQYVYLESEANYSRCKITYGRKIPLNSPLIKGYFIL